MAQTAKKKPAAKKTSASKKKNGSKNSRKKKQTLTLSDIIFKQEFKATVVFILGIICLIVAFLPGGAGSLWNQFHELYYDTLGAAGICLPFALLFLGITDVMNRQKREYSVKCTEVFVLFVLISGYLFINRFAENQTSLSEALKNVYSLHGGVKSGGFVGGLIGGSFYFLTNSKAVANIILVLLTVINVMVLFRITLFKLFSSIERPAKKVGEYTGEVIEKTKSDYEKYRTEKDSDKAERAKRAEETAKQRKKSNRRMDPSTIVNDFYSKDPDASPKTEETAKSGTEPQKSETEEIKPAPATKVEQPSFFDLPAFKEKFANINKSSEKVSETKEEIKPEYEEKPPVVTDPEKKVDPLTAEEAQALNSELNDAVNEIKEIEYKKPSLDLLDAPKNEGLNLNQNELKVNGEKLISALNSFNVSASIVDVVPGPTVTRYELSPAPGVKISKFVGLSDDLALHMAAPAGLRIEAPIPNKAAIGIEIPNRTKTTVTFRETIDTDKFRNAKSKLYVALGKDIAGAPVYSDLAKMPHLLVAGTTGSGKSVCLNTMIVSLLYNATPDEVKILLIDPKQVEFGVYNGLPHLLVPVVSDPRKASGALGWAVTEMLARYKTLNTNGVRDITSYNNLCDETEGMQKMPHIVIFIDELSDLMSVAPAEVEDSIQRLAQMARAAGMHLVVATQRPSVDVITGVIKANIPSRIALTVKSQIDSRTIIDTAGAEKLMGNGDMLYYPVNVPKPIRVQGGYLSDHEIERIVEYIKSNGTAEYDDSVQEEIEKQAAAEKKKSSSDESTAKIDSGDDLLNKAIELFVGTPEKASISALQRHLGLGFAKAGRLMDTLEEKGIVGPHEGSKPRKVLITKAQWYEMNAMADGAPVSDIPPEDDFTEPDETE